MEEEKQLKIIESYKNGVKYSDIKKQFKCSDTTILKLVDKYGLPHRGRNGKTESLDTQLLVKLYNSGEKVKVICKVCKCSTNTISKVLKKFNIPLRTANIRKTNKDFSKFKSINLPETQYWLGYICADGSVQYNPEYGAYTISLYSKDIEIVNKFQKYFGANNVSIHKKKYNGITQMYQAYINSKELCQYFINIYNITPNKSLSLNPNIEYTSNFILGYFDGDGSIINSTENRIRYECNFTSGSKIFLQNIQKILEYNTIHTKLVKHQECNAYKLWIYRKEDSKKLYQYLYTNAVTCLSRKLKNFVELYGNIQNEKLEELQELKRKFAAE